jgi:hypothetical protein
MKVEAFDSKGNRFEKEVKLTTLDGRSILDFGWPVEYYAEDLVKHYPFEKEFCIDMMGKNHAGFGTGPVCISKEDMNKIVQEMIMN